MERVGVWVRGVARCLGLDSETRVGLRAQIERAERERDQAREAAERAERERDQERAAAERAERERDQERAAAERAEKRARVLQLITDGKLWVSIDQIAWSSHRIPSHEEIALFKRSEFWKCRLPQHSVPQTLRGVGGRTQVVGRKGHNSNDAYGREKLPEAEEAHLLPHSRLCREDWLPFLRLIVGQTENGHYADDDALLAMLFGWKQEQSSESIVAHSCIANELFNFISLENQRHLLDAVPRLLFIPVMPVDEMISWNGKGYDCLVIPLCPEDLVRTRGNVVSCDERPEGHSVCTDDQSRQMLESAFSAFATVMCAAVKVMSETQVSEKALGESRARAKAGNCQALREWLATQTEILVPTLPADTTKDVWFRKIKFVDCPLAIPGGGLLDASLRGHNAPQPLLLAARSVNFVISSLAEKKLLPNYKPKHEDVPTLLFLSCKDVTDDKSECEFCFSSESDDDMDWSHDPLNAKAGLLGQQLRCTHDSDLSSSATAPQLLTWQ